MCARPSWPLQPLFDANIENKRQSRRAAKQRQREASYAHGQSTLGVGGAGQEYLYLGDEGRMGGVENAIVVSDLA